MKKKILALAISICFALSACGDAETAATETATSVAVDEQTAGQETAAETETTAAVEIEENSAGAETAASGSAVAASETNEGEGTVETKNDGAVSALHVDGTKLLNAEGQAVRLQGISTLGLAWFPQYVTEETFKSFRDDWGINCIRLAMYTQEDGGYCVSDNAKKAELIERIDTGVQAAVDLGLYVIIDWHILSDGNPQTHQDEALFFFDEMSKKYAAVPNVLYEICNEPNNSSWSGQIKPYAEAVIPVIRKNSPDSVIIVGTNTWSQDVDEVIGNTLNFPNVMYALHFYAATHKDDLRKKAKKALDAGIPIFVSECSICDASGNGGLNIDSANAWRKLIDENGLSFMEWSLSNKAESSAILQPSCTKISGFTEEDYTDSAKFYRTWMRENSGKD